MTKEASQFCLDVLGSEITEWLSKEASGLAGIVSGLKEQWDGMPDMARNALMTGGVGATAGGLMTAISPQRDGEDGSERTMRILRNALVGGLAGGGASAALQSGGEWLEGPINAGAAGRQARDPDLPGYFAPWTLAAGATGGAGVGALRAAMKNAPQLASETTGPLGELLKRKMIAPAKPFSKTWGAAKGGVIGGLSGLALPYALQSFATTADLEARLKNKLQGMQQPQ